jgi:hypothetical protein
MVKPSKRDSIVGAVSLAVGVAIGSGATPEPAQPRPRIELPAVPVESGESFFVRALPKETIGGDYDHDGISDEDDLCPWIEGLGPSGCP